jgi:hypothetical protein
MNSLARRFDKPSLLPKRIMILKEQIQLRIDELIASTDPDPADLRRMARLMKALPIYADMGGCIALRTDGSFVFLDWETEKTSEEFDQQFKIVALVNGSEKYPELKVLLPARPEGANDCEDCNGIGRPIIEGQVFKQAFCGKCWGLGWST